MSSNENQKMCKSMKKTLIHVAIATILAFTFMACEKEPTPIAYNVVSMGELKDGVFIDDNGIRHIIQESRAEGYNNSNFGRVLASYDILEKFSDNEYGIRLKQLIEPLCQDYVNESSANMAVLGSDPVLLEEGWISGDHLNVRLVFTYKKSSTLTHSLNLIYEDGMPSDTLRFKIAHNGKGESYYGQGDSDLYELGAIYASFNIEDLIQEYKGKPVKISYPWYATNGTEIDYSKTETNKTYGKVN